MKIANPDANFDSIPRTIIKGSGFIGGNFDHPNGQLGVLYLNPQASIFGLNNSTTPFAMYISTEYNLNNLPAKFLKDLPKIKYVLIKPSFDVEREKNLKHSKIPDWIKEFSGIEELALIFIDVENLAILSSLSIKQIRFLDILIKDNNKFLQNLAKIKSLEEVQYDISLKGFVDQNKHKIKINFSQFHN
jgi:hypothetical protein